jgi:hypothetical protein
MPQPLTESHLPAAVRLLCESFPERPAAFWQRGMQRLAQFARDQPSGVPLGLGLFEGDTLVGVALTPASLRTQPGGQVTRLVNISSWAIQPAHRWRAVFMLRQLLADRTACYTDLTPTPAVQGMLQQFGLAPVNAGTTVLALPGLAALRGAAGARFRTLGTDEPVPHAGPSSALVQAHRALGCTPLVLEHADGQDLLVYRRSRVRGLPAAQLVYVHSHATLLRHLGPLARHLLAAGCPLAVYDGRSAGPRRWHTWHRPHGVWFARGADFSDRTDFLGSERCLLGV